MAAAVANDILVALGFPASPRAAAEALLGPATEVPRRALAGAAVALARGHLYVAIGATAADIDRGCAYFAARAWLERARLTDVDAAREVGAALREQLEHPPESGMRRRSA